MTVVLKSFWVSLYSHPIYPAFQAYFEGLFRDVACKYDVIEIYSVFGPAPDVMNGDQRVLRVQFSGEGYYHDPSLFDLNLIPHLPTATIVPHLLGAQHLYIHDLWGRLQRPRLSLLENKTHFCTFIVSNGAPVERRDMFAALNAYKPVHSAGLFMQNQPSPPECDSPEYFDYLSRYKFMICFENGRVDYYFTEKLVNAYLGGCVPIYWGCPQLNTFINPRAVLCLDGPCTEAGLSDLVRRVIEVDQDPELYARMLAEPLFSESKLPRCCDMAAIRYEINRRINNMHQV